MGYDFLQYHLSSTEEGIKALIASPFKLNGSIELPGALVEFPSRVTRSEVIKFLKNAPYKIITKVSNEPIIDEKTSLLISKGELDLNDIVLDQRLIDENDWYIDEFGLPVFAKSYAVKEKEDKLIDERY